MKVLKKYLLGSLLLATPILLLAQQMEVEPNNSKETANILSLDNAPIISAEMNPAGDIDFYVMEWQKDCMYYLTSIENSDGVAANLALYFHNNFSNILTSDVGGRNGNGNFRLSGYVPASSGNFYAKIFNSNSGAQGSYKIRLAGGRCREQLIVHEPDNSIFAASSLDYLAIADTVYGAIYPENDIDHYKIHAAIGEHYTIGTLPILDLEVRDSDTFITLYDSLGVVVAENDDIGTVDTPSGQVNCTFSRLTGVFRHSGTYYVAVRSFYNANYGQTISETYPPMNEYGVYYYTQPPEPEDVFARYPHIEVPTTNSVLVQWCTFTPLPTYLEWGDIESCSHSIQNLEMELDHLVKISGLEPETKYYYRVISGEDSSACEYFYTAKPITSKKVNFFVISDTSPYAGFGSSPEQLQVANQIQKIDYDFGLHAGDVNQHHGEEYDLVFFEPYRDILKNATIFPCIGNHDVIYDNGQTYLESFNLPHNNPDSTERYYSVNYGIAHYISLDTNIPYYPGSPQYEWLCQDLESSMRRQTMWTFVYFHHPPWSEGWPGYPGEINVRTHLVPLFEKYSVDMVFNGHTHDYERGFRNGVYYIITGGGGCTLEEGIQAYDWDHVDVWINQHQFTYIQISDKFLKLLSINKDGQFIDMHSFEKNTASIEQPFPKMRESTTRDYQLYQNYPNPFNPVTRIDYVLPNGMDIYLGIYDVTGKEVITLERGYQTAGRHVVTWDGNDSEGNLAASGIYVYRMKAGNLVKSMKMVFAK